jgi:hypothetical protein
MIDRLSISLGGEGYFPNQTAAENLRQSVQRMIDTWYQLEAGNEDLKELAKWQESYEELNPDGLMAKLETFNPNASMDSDWVVTLIYKTEDGFKPEEASVYADAMARFLYQAETETVGEANEPGLNIGLLMDEYEEAGTDERRQLYKDRLNELDKSLRQVNQWEANNDPA